MLERELKLHVPEDFTLPSLDGIAGLRVGPATDRIQEATYWDTPDCRLLGQGVGLRWRSDAGWTTKSPVRGGGELLRREEQTEPGPPTAPPEVLLRPLRALLGGLPLAPTVRLRTARHALELRSTGGSTGVELVDDHVEVLDGPLRGTRWRELELELRPDPAGGAAADGATQEANDEALLATLTERLRSAGAGRVVRVAKQLRALGVETEAAPGSLEAHQLAGRVADGLQLSALRAAGGVVRRDGSAAASDEVLLVHRPHHGDWCLPKGKQEVGETLAVTAVREVREETGLGCELGISLGCTTHALEGGATKTVWWWTMRPLEGSPTPSAETDEVRWFSRTAALRQLTHPGERDLLRRLP